MPDNEKKRPSLTEFIETNHKVITVLGVFTALTIFAGNLELRPYGQWLSFLFLALTVLIWFELWEKFPSEPGTEKLTWFENIFSLTVLGVVFYWLLAYREIWRSLLVVLFFVFILSIVSRVMKRFDLFNRFFKAEPGQKKYLRFILGITFVGGALFLAAWIASITIVPTNEILDQIRDSMLTPTP